jgi:ABC-2 type transport system ATP-binding protein
MTTSPLSPAPSALGPERNAASPEFAVALKGLTKIYGRRGKESALIALDAIDLVIPRGSIFGLLGPNGAGKSTLINILAGLVLKTAGTVQIWGIDTDREPRQSRAAIGVVPQEITLDFFFTPRELLEMQAGFYGVPKRERRTAAILELVALSDKADSPARALSGGMRRRLMVAKAMVHDPPVLVLDEPTAGVDVELRQQLWRMVQELRARGVTILLTTHYLEEAEQLCDRIAIINHGRLVACDTKEALLSQMDDKRMSLALVEPIEILPAALRTLGMTLAAPGRLALRYAPSRTEIATIFAAIAAQGLTIRDVTSQEADLEDIFLQLTRSAGTPR